MGMTTAVVVLVALGLDALLGWPRWLYGLVGHPVSWIGGLVGRLDRWLNLADARPEERRLAGAVAALAVTGLSVECALLIGWLMPEGWVGALLTGVVAWPLIAMRSMHDHVVDVLTPLKAHDLERARLAVARIVGRDVSVLDGAGVARASLESLAENTSDGVVAPVFWGVVFGLPGIVGYKAINTLDSMIGHRSPKYEAFGWASARIDDLANLVPARLTGLLFVMVSIRPRTALLAMWRDAGKHRSPNAGWPEAALAGALDVRLSGPRVYAGRMTDEPWVNGAAPDPQPQDIERGLGIYRMAMLALALVVALCAFV